MDGDLFHIGLVKRNFIPAKNIRILRKLTRSRYKLTSMKSSEKKRFQNVFTVCNVMLDSVVSDMFGKSVTANTDYLTSNEDFDAQNCVSLLQRFLKKKANDVLASIEGYEIRLEQKCCIGIVRDHLHDIEKLIERVDICINAMVEKYDGAISLLCTIPDIDRSSAITVISEIGVDMDQFGSSKRLTAGPVSPLAITNPPARGSLSVFHVREFIPNLRRCKKRAISAIARMILTAIYSILSTGEIWNLVDLFKIDMPEHIKKL